MHQKYICIHLPERHMSFLKNKLMAACIEFIRLLPGSRSLCPMRVPQNEGTPKPTVFVLKISCKTRCTEQAV